MLEEEEERERQRSGGTSREELKVYYFNLLGQSRQECYLFFHYLYILLKISLYFKASECRFAYS